MPTIDQAVGLLRQMRDEVEAINAEALAKTKAIEVKASKIEAWVAQKSLAEGVDSYKTPHGTIYFSTTDFCNVADWDKIYDWIQENDQKAMLTKGVSKTAVRSYLQETGELPPGLNWTQKRVLNLRKPTAKE